MIKTGRDCKIIVENEISAYWPEQITMQLLLITNLAPVNAHLLAEEQHSARMVAGQCKRQIRRTVAAAAASGAAMMASGARCCWTIACRACSRREATRRWACRECPPLRTPRAACR